MASVAMASPICPIRSVSQLDAVVTAVGKQVAGLEALIPSMSLSPSISCLRRPWGPSHIKRLGIPCLSIAFVCQAFTPEHRLIFSSRVIFLRISLYFMPSLLTFM